jgi:hypothetical protein
MSETVRGFWHGEPLSPYQLLCLRSFVDRGFRVELFTYEADPCFPNWIVRCDAREILPSDQILRYPTRATRLGPGPPAFGHGSPALHSNWFRYAMLHIMGGWWIDCDILLIGDRLPEGEYFASATEDGIVVTSALKFPREHPLLADAVERCRELGEDCAWGDTGSHLIGPLMMKHQLSSQPLGTLYPVRFTEVPLLFDPNGRSEVQRRCRGGSFLHLFNEIWRGSGLDQRLGPPEDSFLDSLFQLHDVGARFFARMSHSDIEAATTGLLFPDGR